MRLGKLRSWRLGGALILLIGFGLIISPAFAQEPAEPVDAAAAEAAGDEIVTSERQSGALELFDKGGNFMWPLLFLAVLGLAVILERLFSLQRAHTNTRDLMASLVSSLKEAGGVDKAKNICMRTRGPIAAILHAGLSKVEKGPSAVEKAIEDSGHIEMAFLQRGLPVLSTVANIAPLLGFLGTVSGMINAFEAIAAAEQVSAKVVASGISEALITTMSGLVIAIPAQAMYNYFMARIDRFVLEMEETSVELLDVLTDQA